SLGPSPGRSTYGQYASRPGFGPRLASEPFSPPGVGWASDGLLAGRRRLCRAGAVALDSRRAARPEGFAKEAFDQLAGGVAREVVVERELARDHVARQVLAAERFEVVSGRGLARPDLDRGVDALAPVVVGNAEDG